MFKTQSQSQQSQLVVNSSASITIKMDFFVEEEHKSRTRHEGMQNNRRAVTIGTRSSGCLVPLRKVSVLDNATKASSKLWCRATEDKSPACSDQRAA